MLRKLTGGSKAANDQQQFPAGQTVQAQGSFECRNPETGEMTPYKIEYVHVLTPKEEATQQYAFDGIAKLAEERDAHLQNAKDAGVRAEELKKQADKHKASGDQHSLKSVEYQEAASQHFKKAEEGKVKLEAIKTRSAELDTEEARILKRIKERRIAKAAKAAEALQEKK